MPTTAMTRARRSEDEDSPRGLYGPSFEVLSARSRMGAGQADGREQRLREDVDAAVTSQSFEVVHDLRGTRYGILSLAVGNAGGGRVPMILAYSPAQKSGGPSLSWTRLVAGLRPLLR